MMANMITVGAAYQAGILPLTALAIEHAIRLNGVAVEMNLLAFQVGPASGGGTRLGPAGRG